MKPYPRKITMLFSVALSLLIISGCGKTTTAVPLPVQQTTPVVSTTTQAATEKLDTNSQAQSADILFINLQIVREDLLVGSRHFQKSVWKSMTPEAKQLIIEMVLGNYSDLADLTHSIPYDEKVVEDGENGLTRYLYNGGIEIESGLDCDPQVYYCSKPKTLKQHLPKIFETPNITLKSEELPGIKSAFILGSDLILVDENNLFVKTVRVGTDCVQMMVKDVVGDKKPELVLGYGTRSSSMAHDIVYQIASGEITPYDFSVLCEAIQNSQVATLENKTFSLVDNWHKTELSSPLPDKFFLNSKEITNITPCFYRVIHTQVNQETQKLEIICSWYFEVISMCDVLLAQFSYSFEPMSTDKLLLKTVYEKYSDETPNQTTFDIKKIDIHLKGKPIFNTGDSEEIINQAIASSVKDEDLTFKRSYSGGKAGEKIEYATNIEIRHPSYHILNNIHVGMTVDELRSILGPEDESNSNGLTYYGVSMPDWGFMFSYFQIECLMFEFDKKDKEKVAKIIIKNFYSN